MFWLWEQFPKGGSRTCEAVVYDWPLLQVGYIYNGQSNVTRMETCQQCPDDALIVGQALNADPYGIALPSSHPLFRYLQEKALAVIRKAEFRQLIQEKWRLGPVDRGEERIDFDGDWELSKLFALYYLYAVLGLVVFCILWCFAFRSLRAKLNMGKIDARLQDSDTASYLLEETGFFDSSAVHLSEDYGLVHDIRVQVNRVQAAVAQLLHAHHLTIISAPGHEPDDLNQDHRQHSQGSSRDPDLDHGPGEAAPAQQAAVHRRLLHSCLPPSNVPPQLPLGSQPKMIYVDTLNSNMTISFPSLQVTTHR
jgi:hypothetical protein